MLSSVCAGRSRNEPDGGMLVPLAGRIELPDDGEDDPLHVGRPEAVVLPQGGAVPHTRPKGSGLFVVILRKSISPVASSESRYRSRPGVPTASDRRVVAQGTQGRGRKRSPGRGDSRNQRRRHGEAERGRRSGLRRLTGG